MINYKHTETKEYVKNSLIFEYNTNFTDKELAKLLGLTTQNFQDIVFI